LRRLAAQAGKAAWSIEMRKEHRSSAIAPVAWLLPEDAYCALIEARDQMRLMARLAAPRVALEPEEVPLSTTALSQCFDRVARELDTVVQAARLPRRGG
jgi:hypothetical protein